MEHEARGQTYDIVPALPYSPDTGCNVLNGAPGGHHHTNRIRCEGASGWMIHMVRCPWPRPCSVVIEKTPGTRLAIRPMRLAGFSSGVVVELGSCLSPNFYRKGTVVMTIRTLD